MATQLKHPYEGSHRQAGVNFDFYDSIDLTGPYLYRGSGPFTYGHTPVELFARRTPRLWHGGEIYFDSMRAVSNWFAEGEGADIYLSALRNFSAQQRETPLFSDHAVDAGDSSSLSQTPLIQAIHVRLTRTTYDVPTRGHPRTDSARGARDELCSWLNLTTDQVAKLCGFSVRTSRYWDRGKGLPRLSTVRRLHEIHGLVSSLIAELGLPRTREWLAGVSRHGPTRLALLGGREGVSLLLDEAAPFLFAQAPRPELPVSDQDEAAAAREYAASARKGLPDGLVGSRKGGDNVD